MQPARTKHQTIGSLLFNTGGPGGQATVELIDDRIGLVPFSDSIRDRFDIVAIDPRGIGLSEQIRCNSTVYNEIAALDSFVTTQSQFDKLYEASPRFEKSCIDLTWPLIRHLDSATVAHDFEAVRVALGDEPLNYLGLSYGTLIGQAYLELYPNNVRTMVLDGNVDHTQLQQYAKLTESRTYESTLNQFFDWCERRAHQLRDT